MNTIAVDFDGVIHAYSQGWHDGTIYDIPVEGAFHALRSLMELHAVYIHTTRDPNAVATWIMQRSNIPTVFEINVNYEFWEDKSKLLVTNKKLPAIAYIDDRAIKFENWSQALAQIERISPAIHDEKVKEEIEAAIDDLVSDFLYYDRKNDEDLPLGKIQNSIEEGIILIEELVEMFKKNIIKGLDKNLEN